MHRDEMLIKSITKLNSSYQIIKFNCDIFKRMINIHHIPWFQLSDLDKKLRISVSDSQLGVSLDTKVIEPILLCPVRGFMSAPNMATKDKAVKKHRRTSSNVTLGPPSSLADTSQMSRRLRLIDFLADTRVIQRFIMVRNWGKMPFIVPRSIEEINLNLFFWNLKCTCMYTWYKAKWIVIWKACQCFFVSIL